MSRSPLPLLALTLAAACGTEDSSPATTPPPVGSVWTVRATGTLSDLEAVAYGGAFVAVGRGGVILRSEDGRTWHAVDSMTSADLHGVIYAASRFVAVGDSATILTSPTGEFWARVDPGTDDYFSGVAYASRYLVLGTSHILDSSDTKTWVPHSPHGAEYASAIASDGSALADRNKVLTNNSSYGYDWTEHALPDPMFVANGITAVTGPAVWVVGSSGTAGHAYLSGQTWQADWTWQGGRAAAAPLNALAVRKGIAVAVGDAGTVVSLTQGQWAPRPSRTHERLNAIAAGGDVLVAVGEHGTIISE